jgi:hypothetical protein
VNLYALTPDDETVDTLDDGWRIVEDARQLWSLVDPARAEAVHAVQAKARENAMRLRGDDIAALLAAVAGIEDALVGRIVDEDWRVAADRVAEIAARAPALDRAPSRSLEDRRHAVGEAMQRVNVLELFLTDARERGNDVVAE